MSDPSCVQGNCGERFNNWFHEVLAFVPPRERSVLQSTNAISDLSREISWEISATDLETEESAIRPRSQQVWLLNRRAGQRNTANEEKRDGFYSSEGNNLNKGRHAGGTRARPRRRGWQQSCQD